jgi:pimeloyl-ACP methyl ester carboxylesterase
MIDGVAVHTMGSGPSIVLLHANGGDSRDFEGLVSRLAESNTVHAVDWPGHGASTSTAEQTACSFAALLPSVLEQLPGAPFVLLGNSVGGFAAVSTTARRPELVRGLVLVNPGGFTPQWLGSTAACRFIASRPVAPLAMRLLPRAYLRQRTAYVDDIRNRLAAASRIPAAVATFASLWRSFADRDHDARQSGQRVAAPTLLVWGRRDPILPWRVDGKRAAAALPHAEVELFPCGHQAFAELPDEFHARLQQFLS